MFCSAWPLQCRCLLFCSPVARLVRVVSAALIPGSSGFFDTPGLVAFLQLPVLLFQLFLSGADGCPHTVVLLKFICLCFCATAADLFWADILLHGYPFLGVFCLSSPLSLFGYAIILRMLRGHWPLSIGLWWVFLRRFQRSHCLGDVPRAGFGVCYCKPGFD